MCLGLYAAAMLDGGLGVIPGWATHDVHDGRLGMQLRASLTMEDNTECLVTLMTLCFPLGAHALLIIYHVNTEPATKKKKKKSKERRPKIYSKP